MSPSSHLIHYTVDGEPQTTESKSLSPVQIMTLAGLSPENRYLIQILPNGNEKVSYQDSPSEPIHLHEKMRFVTVSTAPSPVS